MDKTDALSNVSVLLTQWHSYWVIPVGMLLLYFYGRVHFNTPSYALTQNDDEGQPLSDPGRLVSLAPPAFTTARSRFNRYAWRYIVILEVAFLALLFLPSIFSDVGRIVDLQLPVPPSSEILQYRALLALFVLTGLLSSFPILKEVDGHILKKLHAAAHIPAGATRLAEILRAADFVVNPATKQAVEDLLKKRDTLAVSRAKSMGTLEAALLKTLWLRTELLQLITEQQYLSFRLAMARDIDDVTASWANLKPTLVDYFEIQEKLITASVANIDAQFHISSNDQKFAALMDRRQQLTKRCIALFQRMCLLVALLVYGTKMAPDEMGKTIRKVGFQIDVPATPAWDWDTIASVVASVFAALVAINTGLIFVVFWWKIDDDWSRSLTRSTMLFDAVVDTVPFAFVLLIAIRLKRRYRLNPNRPDRPENLLVAVFSFLLCALYYLVLQLAIDPSVTAAPVLLAITPCVAGYFAGRHIDNSLDHRPLSWSLVCWQAILQGLGTAMAVYFSFPVNDPIQTIRIVGYAGCESAVVGLLIGYLFQRFYQRSEFIATTTMALPPKQTNNVWYHLNESSSVIVFVHGILSDSLSCWLSKENGRTTYWPQLVTEDTRLQHPAVFLGGFYTAIDAGKYDISDCAKELLNGLAVPDSQLHRTPLEQKRLVFICHSTGGIVVRYMVTRYADRFREKEIGLVLLASPSFGSKLANTLGGLASFYDNQLGLHLKWGNDVLKNLDDEFKELLDRKAIPHLMGIEACENHFVLHRKLLPDKQFVVERESAGRYFTVRMLQNTDHFSTVKPTGLDHPAHKLLVEFWLRHYGPPFVRDLQDLLETSKEDMRARNLPYFTPAILLALLYENGVASSVLNSVRPDSAKELRARFRQYLDHELPATSPGVFQDFDWFGRDDVQRAQQFALEERVSGITERILLKAVLLSPESKAVGQIKEFFAADFDKVIAEIEYRRKGAPVTPGM